MALTFISSGVESEVRRQRKANKMELTSRQATLIRNALLNEALDAQRISELADISHKDFWLNHEQEVLAIREILLSHVNVIIP